MNIHEENFYLNSICCAYVTAIILQSFFCSSSPLVPKNSTDRKIRKFFLFTSVVHFQSTWHHHNHTAYSKPNGTILFASFMYAALLSIHCSYILCCLATTHSRSWWNVTKFILRSFFSCLLILGAVKSETRYRGELKRFTYFFCCLLDTNMVGK